MKAITIQQPWAWAIIFPRRRRKDIENRTWNTSVRGSIAIHAGLKIDRDAEFPDGCRQPSPEELVTGHIIGVADLVDVVEESDSEWFSGPFGFVLKNPRPLQQPVPCKGMLGFWSTPSEVEKQIKRQLKQL